VFHKLTRLLRIRYIERFHSRGQQLAMQIYWNKRKCLQKKRVQLDRIGLAHQHGRRFIVLEHQYGCRDVMWKRSIGPLKRVSGRGLGLVLKKGLGINLWESYVEWVFTKFAPGSFGLFRTKQKGKKITRTTHVALPAAWHKESESNDPIYYQGKYCVLDASLSSCILIVFKTDTHFH